MNTLGEPETEASDTEASDLGAAEPRGGFFLNVVPAMLYVLAVFYGGGMGGGVIRGPDLRHGDKILHALAFAGMVFVLRRALLWLAPGWPAARTLLASACASAAVGGLLELYQMALPHRSAEWLDFAADALGAGLAAGVLWQANRPRNTEPAS